MPLRKRVMGSLVVGSSAFSVGLGSGGLLVLRLRVLRVMVGVIASEFWVLAINSVLTHI